MGYSFRLAARVLLYASSHRQDNTYHGLCYTSRGMRNGSTMNDRSDDPSHHKRTLLPRSYISLNGSTMNDRSDDPSHHKRTLLPRSYISLNGSTMKDRSDDPSLLPINDLHPKWLYIPREVSRYLHLGVTVTELVACFTKRVYLMRLVYDPQQPHTRVTVLDCIL